MSIRDGAAGFVAKLVAAVDYHEGERHPENVLTNDALEQSIWCNALYVQHSTL